MADINADVHHLWTTKAAFPTLSPGAKYKTSAFDEVLGLLMMKDDSTDTIAAEWSKDTLQCLLAGNQTLTGNKNFSGALAAQGAFILQAPTAMGAGAPNFGSAEASPTDVTSISYLTADPAPLQSQYAIDNAVDNQFFIIQHLSTTTDQIYIGLVGDSATVTIDRFHTALCIAVSGSLIKIIDGLNS